jgi:hypothetical protein
MYYTEIPRKLHVAAEWNEEEGVLNKEGGRKGCVEETMSLNRQEQQ